MLIRGRLQRHGSGGADADCQRDLQRQHRADADHRQPAAHQQDRPSTRLTVLGKEQLLDDDGRRLGVLVPHRAVGEFVVAGLGTDGDIEVVGQRVLVDSAGAGVLCVGQRRRRRREQRRVRRGQRGPAGQRGLRLLGHTHVEEGRGLQHLLERSDVDARADEQQPARQGLQLLQPGDHRAELPGRVAVGLGANLLLVDIGDGAVGGLDDRQGRGIGFHQQHRGALVTHCAADVLRQRRSRQKRRDQHDIVDPASRQRVAQGRGFELIGPRHPDGGELQAGVGGALPGAQNGRDHPIRGARGGRVIGAGDIDRVLFHRRAIGVFAFQNDHLDRRRCHRHPEHDIQDKPLQRCCAIATARRRKKPRLTKYRAERWRESPAEPM
ncbi:hypothetical protein H8Z48_01845 [Mycobacterium avium subsp. hominissuis]|nr:hypothetical protein [Mycobacterium avium]UBV01036.1 hypothetical protein H8Z48_01845 [Mycobacterium avium subsp. hominissuis]